MRKIGESIVHAEGVAGLVDLLEQEILRKLKQTLLDAVELREVRIGEVHAAPTRPTDLPWC